MDTYFKLFLAQYLDILHSFGSFTTVLRKQNRGKEFSNLTATMSSFIVYLKAQKHTFSPELKVMNLYILFLCINKEFVKHTCKRKKHVGPH